MRNETNHHQCCYETVIVSICVPMTVFVTLQGMAPPPLDYDPESFLEVPLAFTASFLLQPYTLSLMLVHEVLEHVPITSFPIMQCNAQAKPDKCIPSSKCQLRFTLVALYSHLTLTQSSTPSSFNSTYFMFQRTS